MRIFCGVASPFRTKWGPSVKNWCNIAVLKLQTQPFRTNEGQPAKTGVKMRFSNIKCNLFTKNDDRIDRMSKTGFNVRFRNVRCNHAQNDGPMSKTAVNLQCWNYKLCNLFARNEGQTTMTKTGVKFCFYNFRRNLFARHDGRKSKQRWNIDFGTRSV